MNDLDLIKKYYGEDMSHLCRSLFPTILEENGLLFKLLSSKFAYSKFLYQDIKNEGLEDVFKNYIYSLLTTNTSYVSVDKNPFDLMREACYTLYECNTQEDILKFKKYYKKNEELCTFHMNRLDTDYVLFAVKDGAENLKREEFINPKREDEYGTSVISIQFARDTKILSIKNRYNHTVNNPDATFSNNLENIIPGLTKSFENYYDFTIENNPSNFYIPNYVLADDHKLYRFNYEINNIYICPNNLVIKNGHVINEYADKSKYFLLDYFMIDKQNKRLIDVTESHDEFYYKYKEYNSIDIRKTDDGYSLMIKTDRDVVYIKTDKKGCMISYKSDTITDIENFLSKNIYLENFSAPSLEIIGDYTLAHNRKIRKLYLPNTKTIGHNFLYRNEVIEQFIAPKLEVVGINFLYYASNLSKLDLSNLLYTSGGFLYYNDVLEELNLPKATKISSNTLYYNKYLNKIEIPNVELIGEGFLANNIALKEINLPNVTTIGRFFLRSNKLIKNILLPNVTKIGSNFLETNECLENIYAPKLREVGDSFLANNKSLKELYLNELVIAGSDFLFYNSSLEKIELYSIMEIGRDFLYWNNSLEKVNFPFLRKIGPGFINLNECSLKQLMIPMVKCIYSNTLEFNKSLEYIELCAERIDKHFLDSHPFRKAIISSLEYGNKWPQEVKKLTKKIF